MENELTVQQVVERTGLSEHTLRYYERIGLVSPVQRATNGHRRYSEKDVRWIIFVKQLRAAGMPISTVRHYIALQRQGSSTMAERLALLQKHRDAVQQQMQELNEHLIIVERKIHYYLELESPEDDTCP